MAAAPSGFSDVVRRYQLLGMTEVNPDYEQPGLYAPCASLQLQRPLADRRLCLRLPAPGVRIGPLDPPRQHLLPSPSSTGPTSRPNAGAGIHYNSTTHEWRFVSRQEAYEILRDHQYGEWNPPTHHSAVRYPAPRAANRNRDRTP